jgi:MoaA/NifB/PqqE/SkfB family radical SAM enzyme
MIAETKYIHAFNYTHLFKKQIPLQGCLEITYLCNHRCIHCSIINRNHQRRKKELRFEQICKIIDGLAQAGCLWLVLTGGEPFIRRDFLDIYKYIKRKGILITIDTNITLLTHEIVDFLEDNPPHGVETTLFSLNKQTFDSITGIQGSFDRFMKGLNLLLEHKIPFSCIRTPTLKFNKDDIEDVKNYVEGLGIHFYTYHQVDCTIDGLDIPLKLALSPEEVIERELEMGILDRETSRSNGCEDDCMSHSMKEAFIINPYGEIDVRRVIPCFPSNIDIRNRDFLKCWRYFLNHLPFYTKKSLCDCKNCSLLLLCKQCATHIKLKSIRSKFSNYYCQIAALRKEHQKNFSRNGTQYIRIKL